MADNLIGKLKKAEEIRGEKGLDKLIETIKSHYSLEKRLKRINNARRYEGYFDALREVKWQVTGRPYWRQRITEKQIRTQNEIISPSGLNICYNSTIQEDYEEGKDNILIALESPAVVRHEGWLDDEMEFVAEISFENFYETGNFYCPKDLYVNHDRFVSLQKNKNYSGKGSLVSSVISHNEYLEGHKFRHKILKQLGDRFDPYGSGTETGWIDDKSVAHDDYMFQIVVENYKNDIYVTEKFFDCIKTKTIPIYHGGKESVIALGFDPEGIIFFENIDELKDILENRISEEIYEDKREAVENNFERLIELRFNRKMEYHLNSVMPEYFPTFESYFYGDKEKLNIRPSEREQ